MLLVEQDATAALTLRRLEPGLDRDLGALRRRDLVGRCTGPTREFGAGDIQQRIGTHQQHALGRSLVQQRASAAPTRPGAGTGELGTHGIRRFAQETHAGAGLRADPLRECQQISSLRVLGCGVAQQHRLLLAMHQSCGHSVRRVGGLTGHRCRHALRLGHHGSHVGQARQPLRRRQRQLCRHWHQPVVGHRMQCGHRGAVGQ